MYFAQYPWIGEPSAHLEHGESGSAVRSIPLPTPLTRSSSNPAIRVFDPFANRVVVVNGKGTKFYTVFATEFTSEGGKMEVGESLLAGEMEKEEVEEWMELRDLESDVFGPGSATDESSDDDDDESEQVGRSSGSRRDISAPPP